MGARESFAQVPETGDTVFVASPDGVVVTLSQEVPLLKEITVGNFADATPPGKLVLAPGARLEAALIQLGRTGNSRPETGGALEVQENATCVAKGRMTVGGRIGKTATSNGELLLRGGEVVAGSLFAGEGGKGEGSLISVGGSKSNCVVSKNAKLDGADPSAGAAGVTVEFLFDKAGVSPLSVAGDLALANRPRIRVNLGEFQIPGRPFRVPLLRASGTRDGDFADPEVIGLPPGLKAVVEWSASNELVLRID